MYYVASALEANPELELVYTDEDKIDEQNLHFDPHFKPDWNPMLFTAYNYICHFVVCRADLVKRLEGLNPQFNGCQDYDFLLRATRELPQEKIHHIPQILYHWRSWEQSTAQTLSSKPYITEATVNALNVHASAICKGAGARGGHHHGTYKIDWPVPKGDPEVTIVIPTRDAVDLMKVCVGSIMENTDYGNYKILIIDNQSEKDETLQYFSEIDADPKVEIWKYDAPFDYAKMHNEAIKHVSSPYLCFMNNDIEVTDGNWLHEMISYMSLEDIGAVGARLLYPDRKVQHSGVMLGVGYMATPVAGHYFHGIDEEDHGYMARAKVVQDVMGATAACLLTRTELFNKLGGFDEELAIAFNDVDYCMKVKDAGHRIILTPYAELIHHESASRGKEDTPEKIARFRREVRVMRRKWGKALDADPFYNPNLSYYRGDFSLAWPPRPVSPWRQKKKRPEIVTPMTEAA